MTESAGHEKDTSRGDVCVSGSMNTCFSRIAEPPSGRSRSSNVASFESASNVNVTVAGPENGEKNSLVPPGNVITGSS